MNNNKPNTKWIEFFIRFARNIFQQTLNSIVCELKYYVINHFPLDRGCTVNQQRINCFKNVSDTHVAY